MSLPRCLVIIPDGNRRWAESRSRPRSIGHLFGLNNCRRITKAAFAKGIEHVVLWGASESNLKKRTKEEVDYLFRLLKKELRRREHSPAEARFYLCGTWGEVNTDPELPALVQQAHMKSTENTHHLTVLFGYNGTVETLHAINKATRESHGEEITEKMIRKHLWTAHVPNVDFVIRTGVEGDPHMSDSLLPWQMPQAQLYYSDICWPAFCVDHFNSALENYAIRKRRVGA